VTPCVTAWKNISSHNSVAAYTPSNSVISPALRTNFSHPLTNKIKTCLISDAYKIKATKIKLA
jgi:hypothetical protein